MLVGAYAHTDGGVAVAVADDVDVAVVVGDAVDVADGVGVAVGVGVRVAVDVIADDADGKVHPRDTNG